MLKYDGIAAKPDAQPQDLTEKFGLPKEQHHNWKYVAFGPDGKLYVPFGAPCNICEPPKEYGDTIMAAALYGVSDADIRALAHFLSRSKTAR